MLKSFRFPALARAAALAYIRKYDLNAEVYQNPGDEFYTVSGSPPAVTKVEAFVDGWMARNEGQDDERHFPGRQKDKVS